ncbi:Glutathione S-transferase N-terminal [Trinorchestia longiramus]|nr:Glutathione S-transferase N-terminal [Trinorchestia longiramus]
MGAHTKSTAGDEDDAVQLYVKAGVDGQRHGACPFCQRVYMVMMLKAQHGILKFQVEACSPAKPPEALKQLGLKHLPAIVHAGEGFDVEDDIIQYLDERFPGGGLSYDCAEAEIACQDFFSKFCFFIKAVNQDSSKLDHALEKLNCYLEASTPPCTPVTCSPPPPKSPTSPTLTAKNLSALSCSPASSGPSFTSPASSVGSPASPVPSSGPSSPLPAGKCALKASAPPAFMPTSCTNWPVVNASSSKLYGGSIDSGAESLGSDVSELQFLTSSCLSHLDCVVLPKLQHVRVAAAALKAYHIPTRLRGIWRYLHNAYNNPIFAQTCPCDQEIILHWHDRPETKKLSHKKHAEIAKEKPKFSFDVPVRASVVTVVEAV